MSSIHPYYFCLLTLVFLVTECAAFPGGAAHYSCESLKPGHGDDHTSLSNNTFRVRVSSLEVPAGDTLNVLIDGTGNSFRGFLVKSVIKGTNIYFGKFVPGVNTVSRCERSGLTHDDGKVNKTERVLKWVAPGDVKRKVSVEFRSSIVYNYDSYYYVNSRSVLVVPTTTPTPTPAPARPPPTSKDAPKPREPTPRRNAPQKDNFQETLSPQARRQITQEENHSHEELNLPLDPACGHSVGCFHDCEVGYCSFIVTWKDKGEVIHFHMKKIEPSRSERWMAIGFSDDEYMGDDSCVECVIDRGVVNVYSSYNEDKTNKRMTDKTAGLKNAAGSYVNGVLECSFDRIKKDDFYTKLKNLEDDVYLMFADGEAITGNLFPHDYQKLPDISPTKVDLQSFANVGGEGPVFPLVRAHGCFMMLSWIILSGVGLVTARYGKSLMPKTHFFGLKIWFQIHRTFMVISVCVTLISVLLVIVEAEGYSKIPNIPGKQYHHLHPPLGIVVIVLTIVNPVMALFRPGPETVGRPVFNWAHWAVGIVAQVVAVIAMFIGLDLPKTGAGEPPMIVLAIYVVYLAAFIVIMELLPLCLKQCSAKQTRFELSPNLNLRRGSHHKEYDVTAPPSTPPPPTAPVAIVSQPEPTGQQENRIKCILLLVHYIVTGILGMTMVLLVAAYRKETAHIH